MAAESGRQAIAAAQEIDGASLAVILRKDAAIAAFRRTEPVPRLPRFRPRSLPIQTGRRTTAARTARS